MSIKGFVSLTFGHLSPASTLNNYKSIVDRNETNFFLEDRFCSFAGKTAESKWVCGERWSGTPSPTGLVPKTTKMKY